MVKDLIRRISWWGWILIIVVVLFLFNYASSMMMNRSLFNVVLDSIRKDQIQALEDRDEQLKLVREQNKRYQEQVKEVQREKEVMRQRAERSAAEVARLKGENNALRQALQNVVVSNDPDRIIDDLNKMGYGPVRRVR